MDYINFSDIELVERLNHDDRAAFNEIYIRYWKDLYLSAFHILKDEDACMDLCQDVFIWIWQHRGNLKINNIGAYLKTAVKYKISNFIRHGKVKENFFSKIERLGDLEPAVNDQLEVKELRQVIEQFTEGLPDRCKQVFQLSRFDEMSNREIALKMGISEKTVENQITSALKKLKISLARLSIRLLFL